MSLFYVDKNVQDNGDHEVHTANCTHNQMAAIIAHIQATRLKINKFDNKTCLIY